MSLATRLMHATRAEAKLNGSAVLIARTFRATYARKVWWVDGRSVPATYLQKRVEAALADAQDDGCNMDDTATYRVGY